MVFKEARGHLKLATELDIVYVLVLAVVVFQACFQRCTIKWVVESISTVPESHKKDTLRGMFGDPDPV